MIVWFRNVLEFDSRINEHTEIPTLIPTIEFLKSFKSFKSTFM